MEEKLFAGDSIFSTGTAPDIMLTGSQHKARVTRDEAMELAMICTGLNKEEDVTYEVIKIVGYFVTRCWRGQRTHYVVPMENQIELKDWKKRIEK